MIFELIDIVISRCKEVAEAGVAVFFADDPKASIPVGLL